MNQFHAAVLDVLVTVASSQFKGDGKQLIPPLFTAYGVLMSSRWKIFLFNSGNQCHLPTKTEPYTKVCCASIKHSSSNLQQSCDNKCVVLKLACTLI